VGPMYKTLFFSRRTSNAAMMFFLGQIEY